MQRIKVSLKKRNISLKKSFYLVLGAGLLLEIVRIFVVGVYFAACTLCVICLLHKGRSRADQCDQDTRLTSIVGKNKQKIWTQIVKSVGVRCYALNTLPIAFTKPPESLPASITIEISYC